MDKTAGSRKWKEGWRCTSNNHKPNPKPTDTRWRPGLGQVTSQEPFAFLMKHSHSSGNEQFPRVCFKHPITKWEKKNEYSVLTCQDFAFSTLHLPLSRHHALRQLPPTPGSSTSTHTHLAPTLIKKETASEKHWSACCKFCADCSFLPFTWNLPLATED